MRNNSAADKTLFKFATKSYRAKFVRDILEIHPIKGLDVGMCIELSSKNVSLLKALLDRDF